MIETFSNYLEAEKCLSLQDMENIHQCIRSEVGNDPNALELYHEIEEAAVRYSYFRANWPRWGREEKMEKDASRTLSHDMLIIKLGQMARYLRRQGKTAAWREQLGSQ